MKKKIKKNLISKKTKTSFWLNFSLYNQKIIHEKIEHKIKKGDIFVLENLEAFGHEQKGIRPHIVVTQIIDNVATISPCTTSLRKRKYTTEIFPDKNNNLKKKSFVLISQSFAVDINFLNHKIGHLSQEDIFKIQLEYIKYVSD